MLYCGTQGCGVTSFEETVDLASPPSEPIKWKKTCPACDKLGIQIMQDRNLTIIYVRQMEE